MSFDMGVWYPSERLDDKAAADLYVRLCEGNLEGVTPHPAIEGFYQELTFLHPQIDDIPEDRIDDTDYCPWSIAFDRSPGHLIMSCVWSKADYCRDLIMKLGAKHGLAVFNPQESTITYPESGPSQGTERKPWWRFW